MIHTFLPDIFVMDNHLALQERLLGLQHMLAYLDPVLSNHLVNIGVTPNLYAISWLLTMFAHVLRIDLVFQVWDALLSLSQKRKETNSNISQGLPVLFAAVLLCRLREFILGHDFAATTIFLTSLPCPMADIVRDVLHTMPLACKMIPKSVLSLTPSTFHSSKQQKHPENHASDATKTNNSNTDETSTTSPPPTNTLFEREESHYISHVERQKKKLINRNEYIEAIKYERSPRILIHEALAGPMFDKSLVVDVRTVEAFQEIHLVSSFY